MSSDDMEELSGGLEHKLSGWNVAAKGGDVGGIGSKVEEDLPKICDR